MLYLQDIYLKHRARLNYIKSAELKEVCYEVTKEAVVVLLNQNQKKGFDSKKIVY